MRGDRAGEATASGGRHFLRHGPSRRWMTTFFVLLAVSAVAATALTYVGIKTVRNSRAGKTVSTVTDPAAPGFEAFLEPTPTLALLHRDGNSLRSIAVLALSAGDQGGAALLVSPDLRSSTADDALSFASVSGFSGGPESVMGSLQSSLGFGIREVALIDDARWAELVAPVAPIQVENPSSVEGFPAGSIALGADQVGRYLAARAADEGPEAPLLRQQAFYRAWLAAVAASDAPDAVPGELESGVGRFVRGLTAAPARIETVPIAERAIDGGVRYDVDEDVMASIIGEIVPYPVGGRPGGRVRVRLLDGTGDPEHVQRVAPMVVPADAEIVVVGNAEAFDYEDTEIRYHAGEFADAAEEIRATLGAGEVVDDPRQTDAFDVTIVLGTDL